MSPTPNLPYWSDLERVCGSCGTHLYPGDMHNCPKVYLSARLDGDRLHKAMTLAAFAHDGQTDKNGDPYLWHCLRVGISMLPDVNAAVVGILHDILEDTETDREMVVDAIRPYGECWTAILAITRNADESEIDYLRRLSGNDLALKVKLYGDIPDNTNPVRLAKLPASVRTRLEAKYASAKKILQEIQRPTKGETHEAQSHHCNDPAKSAVDPSNSPESVPEGTGGEAPNRNPSSGSY